MRPSRTSHPQVVVLVFARCSVSGAHSCRKGVCTASFWKWSVPMPTSVRRQPFRTFPHPFIHSRATEHPRSASIFDVLRLSHSFMPVVAGKYDTTLKWPRAKLAQQLNHQPHSTTLRSCRLHRCCQSDYSVVGEALWRAVFGLALTAVASTSHSTNFTPQVLRSAQRSGRNLERRRRQ